MLFTDYGHGVDLRKHNLSTKRTQRDSRCWMMFFSDWRDDSGILASPIDSLKDLIFARTIVCASEVCSPKPSNL